MRKIRLMADYFCYPLWDLDRPHNLDPECLPLSADVRKRLHAWAQTYDRTLNQEYPPDSGFPTVDAERAFGTEGAELWRRISAELGSDYDVSYAPQSSDTEPVR